MSREIPKIETSPNLPESVEPVEAPETPQDFGEKSAMTEQTESAEKISPETIEAAEKFDNKLAGIVAEKLKSEEISQKEANEILSLSKKLNAEDKAEMLKDIETEMNESDEDEKLDKEKEGSQEAESDMSEQENQINNLAERARVVGIEFSPEQILSCLNLIKKLGMESGEKNPNNEQQKEMEEYLGELSKKVEELEKMKTAGKSNSEKEKEIKQDSTKIVEKLIVKAVSYMVKLLMRTAMGVIKGVARGISEGVKKSPE